MLEIVTEIQRASLRGGLDGVALQEGLEALVRWTASAFGFVAEFGDPGAPGLHLLATAASSPSSRVALPRRLRDTSTPWGALVNAQQPVLIAGQRADAIVNDLPFAVHSFVGIPLPGEVEPVGALALFNRPGGYDPEFAALLEQAAAALATVIELRRGRAREQRLEGEVRRWENLYATVIESTGVCLLTTDPAGTIRYANPTAVRILGAASVETLESTNLASFHDSNELWASGAEVSQLPGVRALSPFEAIVARAVASGGVDRRDWTWVSLAGERTPMVVTLTALREPGGGLTGWVVVGTELSEHHALADQRMRAAQLEAQLDLLRQREAEAVKLAAACQYVTASRSLREALAVIGTFLSLSGRAAEFLVQRFGTASGDRQAPATDDNYRIVERGDCWSLKTGQVFISESDGLRCAHLRGTSVACVCAPLSDGTRTVGVISAQLPSPESSTGLGILETRDVLHGAALEMAHQFSAVLANLRLRLTLEEQATRDPLTGAVNRRRLDEEMGATEQWHRRTGGAFALMVFDMDHFKEINDTYGHERGDQVLVGVVRLLRGRFRESDVVARVGGEEFVVLLRGVTLEKATALAEQARALIGGAQLAGPGVPCSCSVGVAHTDQLDVPMVDLLHQADRALYRAKREGRNRVVVESGGSPR